MVRGLERVLAGGVLVFSAWSTLLRLSMVLRMWWMGALMLATRWPIQAHHAWYIHLGKSVHIVPKWNKPFKLEFSSVVDSVDVVIELTLLCRRTL